MTVCSTYKQNGNRCLYNADFADHNTVSTLTDDGFVAVLEQAEQIYETRNAISYRTEIQGRDCFVKRYKPRKLYRRVQDHVYPACHWAYRAALRLTEADLPTPQPLLAAYFGSGRGQVIVTDFCPDTQGLQEVMKTADAETRAKLSNEIADLLVKFHARGFYSRHLRSANILVRPANNGHDFWFIDLDRLAGHRWLGDFRVFVSTVSRASFEFCDDLPKAEQDQLFENYFQAAVNAGFLDQKSRKRFLQSAAQQTYARRYH